jgi:hypothetical protein
MCRDVADLKCEEANLVPDEGKRNPLKSWNNISDGPCAKCARQTKYALISAGGSEPSIFTTESDVKHVDRFAAIRRFD